MLVAIATLVLYGTGLNVMESVGGLAIGLGLSCVVLSKYRASILENRRKRREQSQAEEELELASTTQVEAKEMETQSSDQVSLLLSVTEETRNDDDAYENKE